jgi:hypothetical protein
MGEKEEAYEQNSRHYRMGSSEWDSAAWFDFPHLANNMAAKG